MLNSRSVSIRLKLGGHSLSKQIVSPAMRQAEEVVVVVDTPRVMLVPRSEVVEERMSQMLQLVGKSPRLAEQPILVQNGDICALLAIDSVAYRTLVDELGDKVLFTTPLLDTNHCEERCLVVEVAERVCYMRLYEGGLQRADAVEIATNDDVLLAVNGWVQDKRIPIYIKGGKECVALLKKYYKSVVCE